MQLTAVAALSLATLAIPVLGGAGSYDINNLPQQSEDGQQGTNACGTTNSQSANCQTAYMNNINDFCLWAPPTPGQTIGDSERVEVAWCTAQGHGTRTIPQGAIHSAHWLETPHYIQVTGTGDFTGMNIAAGDEGGELDPHGADGNGNPIGALVYNNGVQIHEWTSFMSDSEYCFRICKDASDAWLWCQHIYDILGCQWNQPGDFGSGFDTCQGDSTEYPPGIYSVNGGLSTYQQSDGAAPSAHPAGASSNCKAQATVVGGQAAAVQPSSAPVASSGQSSPAASGAASNAASASSASSISPSSVASSSAIFNSSTVLPSSSVVSDATSSSFSSFITTVLSTAAPSSATSASSASGSANNLVASAVPSSTSAAMGAASISGVLVAAVIFAVVGVPDITI